MNANLPVWGPENPETSGAFQETWQLKLNDPAAQRALWIRFSILISSNGFRRIAETWAVEFKKGAKRETSIVAARQTHELRSFSFSRGEAGPVIRIGECELGPDYTRGTVSSKGQTISWDLKFSSRDDATYDLLPPAMRKLGRLRQAQLTSHSDILFNGTSRTNGEEFAWNAAPGMQNHQNGSSNGFSWTWGHCNAFTNEQGQSVPFVFEGMTARSLWLKSMKSPQLSSFHFRYEGKSYFFNSIGDLLHLRSWPSLNEWRFRAERGELSFRGVAKAEHKDFAGVTFEDTNGALIYDASSKLSELSIHVYRRGKLEATFRGQGTLALDIAAREKNPYVSSAL